MNKVICTGRIVSERILPTGDKALLMISKNGKDAFPRFICGEKVIIPHHRPHERLKIIGHVAKDIKGRPELRADVITKETTMLEDVFGVTGRFFNPPLIESYFKGEIINLKKEIGWTRLVIRTEPCTSESGLHIKSQVVQADIKNTYNTPTLNKHDTVVAVCGFSTPKKTIDGKTVYFENIIISDIKVV